MTAMDAMLMKVNIVDVVKAAISWRNQLAALALTKDEETLAREVDCFLENLAAQPNRPVGFVFMRRWHNIEPGWFVKTPKGDWIEVVSTELDYEHTNVVLRIGGKERSFRYSATVEIPVKMGSKGNIEAQVMETVKQAFPDSEILEMDWS